MDTKRIAQQIVKAAEAIGIDADLTSSGLSEAQYIDTDFGKIRVAKHDAKPTYEMLHGEAVFTVGSETHASGYTQTHIASSNGDWLDCVAWMANKAGVAIPKRHRTLIAKRDSVVAVYKEKEAAVVAERKALAEKAYQRECDAYEWARVNRPDLVNELDAAHLEMGKRARKRRQGLRHRIFKAWVEAVKTA